MEPEYIVLINNKVNTNILSLRYTLTMCCIYNIVNFVFLAIRKNTGQQIIVVLWSYKHYYQKNNMFKIENTPNMLRIYLSIASTNRDNIKTNSS